MVSQEDANREESGRLPGSLRRELIARGHHLKARLAIGQHGLTEGLMVEVREALARDALIKVRLAADSASEAKALARALAEAIGCQLVQRVGHVALLYQAPERADEAP